MTKFAAITMVYNEPVFLPLWVAHYSKLVGATNCTIVDHGTDDGSTSNLNPQLSIIRLPRSPHDDHRRAQIISELAAQLLDEYDAVVHADVDEIIFPDPRHHASLASFAASTTSPVTNAYGFELIQVPRVESPPLDLARPILQQRQWVRFTSPMCKPVMIRKPVQWSPGFHCVAAPVCFGGLFLFHLRWVDWNIAFAKLQRTRAQPWADPAAAPWQRTSDEAFREIFLELSEYPFLETCSFFAYDPVLKTAADLVIASQAGRENDLYKFSLDIYSSELWRVPKALKSVF